MKLREHEGKQLFRRYGIPTTEGKVVRSSDQVGDITGPMVIKAQVEAGGRGKAGGIRFASTQDQVREAVSQILGMEIRGQRVEEVLVEERVNVMREIYLSMYMDRRHRLPVLMVVKEGGMDVESADPSMVMSWPISPLIGMPEHVAREAGLELMLDRGPIAQLFDILSRMWELFWGMDCELLEINPLAITPEGGMVAVDAKVVIDEDAAFRHPELSRRPSGRTSLEAEAREQGMSLVRLEGDVAVIANGAGLTMATLDVLALHGAKGGVFLDLGGTDDERVVEEAVRLVARTEPRAILVNVFGGITKCDTVAEGLIAAKRRMERPIALVVRLRGVNEERGRQMLRAQGITAMADLDEACAEAARAGGA